MRNTILVLTFVSCLFSGVASNPIAEKRIGFGITEIYIASPNEWYIELDGNWCLFDYKKQSTPDFSAYPCSSDVYLRVKRSPVFYRARVGFAKNKYGIVNQFSLRPTPQQIPEFAPIQLTPNDIVIISMDTAQKVPSSSADNKCWEFPLRTVPSGNSLVALTNLNNKTQFYSTSRKSIGKPGEYTTRYKFTLLDKYGMPLQYFNALGVHYASTDSAGICYVPVSIADTDTVINLRDGVALHPYELIPVVKQSVYYEDKNTLIEKTIRIPVTQYKLNVEYGNRSPVQELHCFKDNLNSTYNQIVLWVISGSDTLTVPYRIYQSLPVSPICFSSENSYRSGSCLGTWSGTYIDTAAVVNVTVSIEPTAISKAQENIAVNSGLTFSALSDNRREIRIVVSSPLSSARGSISLLSINGKEIKTQPVTMNGSGTSTILFRFIKEKLSPGTYLCKLIIDGYSPVSQTIIIH
jgi:hypothetical protein